MAGSTKNYIGVVDMICEGPIHGLVEGKSSVYVNDIPFEDSRLVGTFNETVNGTFGAPTVYYAANSKTGNVINTTLTDKDVGKFIAIEGKKVNGATLTISSVGWPASFTWASISGTGLDSSFTTTDTGSNLKYLMLENSSGVRYYCDGNFLSGTQVSLAIDIPRVSSQLKNGSTWSVTIITAVKIATVAEDGTSFTAENNISTSEVTQANAVPFHIKDKRTIDAEVAILNDSVGKVDGSTVQFRRGTLDQAPIQPVNSISGGITITGQGNAEALVQPSSANLPAGMTLFDTGGYPEGQSYAENSGDVLVIPSSGGTGPNFGLTAAQRQQIDEINIRINYNSLVTYNNEGGEKESASAHYVFQIAIKSGVSSNYSDYKTLFSQTGGKVVHTARTTAPISFDHTIGLSRFKPFTDFKIRIVRLTRPEGLPVLVNGTNGGKTSADKDKYTLQANSAISGANLSATIKDRLTYPFTAHAAVSFSSKTYSSLPTRSYLLQGLKVRIPSSYTPREYTEDGVAKYEAFWDGSFKKDDDGDFLLYYTDNPAWVFYDIITSNRYGAGKWIDKDFINKFALYRIAKYCDELVPDGKGGTEPRFRANLFLTKATDVYKVIKDMATIFIGMVYWLDGKVTAIPDVPSEPIYTFSKANVIDGVFNYETTGRKTKANQVVVTWNNPEANYEPVPLIVEDSEAIVKSKRVISEPAVAMGATSEGQALRYGRWKLWTAQNQGEVVSFDTGLQGAFIRPGDVINIQDRDRYGVDYSGVIKSVSGGATPSITFDRSLSNVINANTFELTTLVTRFAAFYVGLDPIRIDSNGLKVSSGGTLFNRGDRITQPFWYPDATPDPSDATFDLDKIDTLSISGSDIYDLSAEEAEKRISNAFIMFEETNGRLGVNGDTTGSGYNAEPLQLQWKEYTYVVTKTITLNSDRNIGTASSAYEAEELPQAGTVFALRATDSDSVEIQGSKQEFRVLAVSQNDQKNTYSISAVEYSLSKYEAVDKDYALGVTPEDAFPSFEDPDKIVPAPEVLYISLDSDSSKPGEELILTWKKPQETFLDLLNTVQNRDYSFIDRYEIFHNIPELESPISTRETSIRFDKLQDGLYTFRVRAVSRKQNYSDFVSTQYEVNDVYGSTVPRIVGGLPKGIVANSQISYAYDANASSQEGGTEAVRFIEGSSATGFSVGNLLSGDNSPSTGLSNINVSGLVDKVAREWYYLLFEGGSGDLLYWDTDTLQTLPFYKRIPGGSWRGSAISGWDSKTGGYTLAADSTRITFNSSNSSLKIGDIIAFENVNEVEAVSINSVTATSSSYRIGILTNFDNYLINDGDKVKLENATFTGSGTDFNNKEYYAKRISTSTTVIELYKDEALSENVTSSDIGKTWDEGGWVRRIGVKGAKVIAKVSNTEAILDRSFSSALTSSNPYYVRRFQPDFKDDAVFGRVRWNSKNEQTLVNSFSVDSFIQLDPSLTSGKAVLVTPSLETIRYETDDDGTTITQTSEFESLTATVTALGFIKPQFRLTSYRVNGEDTTDLNETISTNFAEPDEVGGFTKEFTVNNDNDVDYGTGADAGAPIVITAEVREANNVGINAFGSGDILRVKDGAAGTQGRTVELTAEDYTIVYDANRENPSFEGNDSNLTLTATSRNFGDNPLFRITINSSNVPVTTFSSWVDGSIADDSIYSTYIIPPTSKPDYSSKVIQVQVAERPQNWNAATQQGQDSEGNPITPTVGASDSISILYLEQGEGGIAIANSNSAHAYTTDSNGEFTGSTITGSGTTIEVLIGGIRGTYRGTSDGTLSSGGFSGTLDPGDWYIVSAVSSTSEFSAGNITASGNIATIGAVNVDNTVGYGEDVEQITWTIRVGTRAGTTIDLTTIQSLSKSKKGSDAATVVEAFARTTTDTAPTSRPTVTFDFDGATSTLTDGSSNPTWTLTPSGVDDTNPYEWILRKPVTPPTSGTSVSVAGSGGDFTWDDPVLFAVYGDGSDAPRTHSGYLYWTSTGVPTNANRPSGTQTYDFDYVGTDAAFSTLGNWSVQAPTIGNDPDNSIDRETIYYITYSVIETITDGVAQGTASSVTFGSVTQGFNFTGLVTFTNLETSGQTTIDGANITTGSIKSSDYTDDTGSLFASQGVKFDLDNDVIETPYFYTTPTGAGFKGSITLASNSDFSINGDNLATVAFSGLYSNLSGTPNLSTVATSGSYSDLSNAPTIPTDLNDLTDNTSLLFDGNYNNLSNLPTLFDGQYSSLTGLPTLFDGNYSSLSGTPTIPSDINDLNDAFSLLFSGNYTDLTNKPTIPDALSDLNNDIGAITGVASGSSSYASVVAGSLTINPTNIVGASTAVTSINTGSTTYASVSNNQLTIVPSAIVLATDAVTSVVDGDSGTGFIALSNNQLTLTPSAINITSLTGVGDLATQNEADLDFISSSTSISAGKIVLSSGSLDFTTNTATADNTIVLDTTSNANRIVIYSGTTPRVVLGKLS